VAKITVVLVALFASAGAATAAPPRLDELPAAPKAAAAPPSLACPHGATKCLGYTDFLGWAGRDVSTFWQKEFNRTKIRWVRARQVAVPPGRSHRTTCSGVPLITATTGPLYCPIDGEGTVFLPLVAIKNLVFPRAPSFRGHAFAISYVVAHEWAHHVQRLLDLLNGRSSIDIELQADCLAGVWGYSAWARNVVSQADIRTTLDLATLIGDDPGVPADAANAHGTGQQRVAAFLAGYKTGRPQQCVKW
jgi:predicted metalloprotease